MYSGCSKMHCVLMPHAPGGSLLICCSRACFKTFSDSAASTLRHLTGQLRQNASQSRLLYTLLYRAPWASAPPRVTSPDRSGAQ